MKKIIYVVDSLCIGGVTELLKNTTYELSKKYEIIIISLGKNMTGWNNENDIPIKCFEIKIEYKYSLFAYFQDMVIGKSITTPFEKVITYIVQQQPDIIHFHTLPRFLQIGMSVKKKILCKLVFTDHLVRIAPSDYNVVIRTMLGAIYRCAYKSFHLVFVSDSVEKVAVKYKFIGKEKKHIKIDNGIDIGFYTPTAKGEVEKVIFIYVARISPCKGHVKLIESWLNIHSNIKRELWLVGPNEMGDTISNLISQSKCNNVKLLGSRNDIKELLAKADVAVFPSEKEGLPLSLLEKMAMELPVIVSNIDELTSVIEHEKDGLIYELGDNDDLTDKMTLLLNDKEMRIKLGKEARKKIEENYSILSVVQKIETFYNSL